MERPHTFKMVLKGLYIWLVHQDLQKKKEIEIVKRSRNSGKVFATKLFTVCYQCIARPARPEIPGFPGQVESTSRLQAHTQRLLQSEWFLSTWKSNVSRPQFMNHIYVNLLFWLQSNDVCICCWKLVVRWLHEARSSISPKSKRLANCSLSHVLQS